MIQVNGHPGGGTGLVPGGIVAAVNDAPAADTHIFCSGYGNHRMQYSASGQIQRLPVSQGNGVHDPLSRSDIEYVRVVRGGNICFRRVGEQVQSLVYTVVEYDGIGTRFGQREADDPLFDTGYYSGGGGKHLGAFDCIQPRHANLYGDRSAEVKIGHWGTGWLSVGTPDMLVIHHYVIHKQRVTIHADVGNG